MGIIAARGLSGVIGLVLAWPRLFLRLAGWVPILSARADRGSYQTNYQFHRAAAVWFLPMR